MKTLKVRYTLLDEIEVPDNATKEEIDEIVEDNFLSIMEYRLTPDDVEYLVSI